MLLGEKGVAYDPVLEKPWDRRDAYTALNPAGRTPMITDETRGLILIDSNAITEYFDETIEGKPLMGGTALGRAEIRRLVAWFDQEYWAEVTQPLLQEKMLKRLVHRQPPDGGTLRAAMKAANNHLDYVDYLVDHNNWLAGATMSVADLAAAAHISVADYLGGIDWTGHDLARGWYAGLKSRPSFRPLLAERMEGVIPPAHYEQVDF